jgi:hypothetical protein
MTTRWNSSEPQRRISDPKRIAAAIAAVRCDRAAGTIELRLFSVPDFDQADTTRYDMMVRFSTEEILNVLGVAMSRDGKQGEVRTYREVLGEFVDANEPPTEERA